MRATSLTLAVVLWQAVNALPQAGGSGETPSTPLPAPTPTITQAPDSTCFETITEVPRLATFPDDPNEWAYSMREKYSINVFDPYQGSSVVMTSGYTTWTFSGTPTSLFLTLWFDSVPISSEGLEIVTEAATTTTCKTTSEPQPTENLPDCVDESVCSPHIDHWHCEPGVEEPPYAPGECIPGESGVPTNPPTTAPTTSAPQPTDNMPECVDESVCSPHIDHWHCEPGVEEPPYAPGECIPGESGVPTNPPTTAPTTSALQPTDNMPECVDESVCSPHIDHWHCEPGVEEPPYAPGECTPDGPGTLTTASTTAPTTPPSQTKSGLPEYDDESESHVDHWYSHPDTQTDVAAPTSLVTGTGPGNGATSEPVPASLVTVTGSGAGATSEPVPTSLGTVTWPDAEATSEPAPLPAGASSVKIMTAPVVFAITLLFFFNL